MTAVSPLHEGHAVAGLTFLIRLSRNLTPQEVEALQPAVDALEQELPMRFEVASAMIEFQNGQGEAHTQRSGQARQRIAPNGQLQWQLNASEDRILVQCADHGDWPTAWQTARRYLEAVCVPLMEISPHVGIVALIHSVLDRFVFDEGLEIYDCEALFREDCLYLTPQARLAGPVWHVHQGWVETLEVPLRGRLLQVLNLGSVIEGGKTIANVDHGMHFQFAGSEPLSSFFGPAPRCQPDTFFEDAHRRNEELLTSCLQDEVLASIGLVAA